ncbi:cytochrome P450 [Myriangium duriaei CBS 260.36]|uniref:Cytochrome P450 n=1 Tax=Myriangium duriaei CBS 260.36 TaxID=1168546 RepID=A0A9P4MJM0_9PEZI|nr:cytochrome P450 [Myriangium duriaei CBS 260.36]
MLSRVWSPSGYLTIFLLSIAALWYRYHAKFRDVSTGKRRATTKLPPTFPYIMPGLGTMPLSYIWNPMGFVKNPKNFFQADRPVRVKMLNYEFYVVHGPENIKELFKNSKLCNHAPFLKYALSYVFGLPPSAQNIWDKDDSGGLRIPHPESAVESRNRVDWGGHQGMAEFLEGSGFLPFCRRYADNITQRLHTLHLRTGDEWEHHTDLMDFVGYEATVSTMNAFCGPNLLRLNPDFVQDYWDFDRNLQTYMRGTPWFIAPKAYAARKRVLDAVISWQQHARDNFHASDIGPDGDDPFWGSSVFRKRHEMYLAMDGYDYAAIASEDFAALWAARNSITATFWAVFDIYRDPELLETVRAEVGSCMIGKTRENGHMAFDMEHLLRVPVLQAVYAETLRLRMHFYMIRMTDREDMPVRDWIIPRKKVIVTLTTVAHMDHKIWSTGLYNEHPVDKFWVGRFLSTPPEGSSQRYSDAAQSKNTRNSTASKTFSMKGMEASWIPFAGGHRQCPGRHFAKRQVLLTIALMIW